MMRSIVLLLSTGAFICGCASTPPPKQMSREVRRPERVVPLGIVHTERTTDVVTVLENVEYALFPSISAVQAPTHPMPAEVRESIPQPKIDYAPLAQNTSMQHMTLSRRTQQCVLSTK